VAVGDGCFGVRGRNDLSWYSIFVNGGGWAISAKTPATPSISDLSQIPVLEAAMARELTIFTSIMATQLDPTHVG